MKVNEFKWASNEAQLDMKAIWNQVRKAVIRLIQDKLKEEHKKKEIPLFEEGVGIEPDWDFPEDWNVRTFATRIYNSSDSFIKSETLQYMSGRLFLTRANSLPLEPSFKFIIDKSKGTLFIDLRLIRRIMDERKALEDDSAYIKLGEGFLEKPLQDDGITKLTKRQEEDLRGTFKFFGHSKDEINLMIHNIVKHESFDEDMPFEDLYKLGRRVIMGETEE